MSEKVTWVVFTDGYYIRIMFNDGLDTSLKVYREADFEQSSDITYKLITRYRVQQSSNSIVPGESSNLDTNPDYLFDLLGKFLFEQASINTFNDLIVISPGPILDKLNDYLPELVVKRIIASIQGDYLMLSQDKLEEALATYLPISR
ncbi:MAG: hypothetical protein ACI9XC_000394 [Gammaproteobacteria bacterium]|jgi:hypothetical protein